MFSERFSVQRVGRPTLRASQATKAYSGSAPIFAPNPPHVPGGLLGPAGGGADLGGRPGDEGFLGVGADLRADPAADVRGDQVHQLGVEPQPAGDLTLGLLGTLVGAPDGHPAVLAP